MSANGRSGALIPPRAGFTLLELLVAISILAVVSMIAWRGLDSLVATRARLEPEGDAVRSLLTAFGQLERDLAQVAPSSSVALGLPTVRVLPGTDGNTLLQVMRLAPPGESPVTRVQNVFYSLLDGQLVRQATPPSLVFQSSINAATMQNARLLDAVKGFRVRVWRDQQGWIDPAADTQTSTDPNATPPGLEVTIERNDGTRMRRVLLVG